MSTKHAVLSLLRRERLTVTELAGRLGLSRNAVIVPLKQLEASGLVGGKPRKAAGAGKPAVEYAAAAGMEDIASSAYPAFAETLLRLLPQSLTRTEIRRLLERTGQDLAAGIDPSASDRFRDRLKAATDFVDGVGAETIVEETRSGAIVRSHSCPLARAVRQESCVCAGVAAFFAAATGCTVTERCQRGERLRCEFEIIAETA